MAIRYGGLDVSARKSGRWAAFLLALALAGVWGGRPASAEVVDSHVLSFGADPAYVNINFTTSISVTIGTSYGASSDNYTATVTKPSGSASTRRKIASPPATAATPSTLAMMNTFRW